MTQLTWFITGCSSGFGEALVLEAVKRGDRVIATARNIDRITHLKGGNVLTMTLDVTASQNDINSCVAEAQDAFGGIDVLVNNAGYVQAGAMEQVRDEKFMEVYKTNLIGPMNITRAILPHFRAKKSGVVVFMGSQSGWFGDAWASAYCASKFALEGLFESFQKETAEFGIKSIIVEPGFFRTNIFLDSHLKVEIDPLDAYAKLNNHMVTLAGQLHGKQPGDPSKAAERILDVVRNEGMAKGKAWPRRLPLGPDALAGVKGKCEETLKICREWEDVITSTNF